jgi:hypothetical protein
MSNTATWLNQTVTRSTVVVPTHGSGMGDVCPQATGSSTWFAGGFDAVTPMRKRHADAIWATPGSARTPWSPPVT